MVFVDISDGGDLSINGSFLSGIISLVIILSCDKSLMGIEIDGLISCLLGGKLFVGRNIYLLVVINEFTFSFSCSLICFLILSLFRCQSFFTCGICLLISSHSVVNLSSCTFIITLI
jgi:hypothetical protein